MNVPSLPVGDSTLYLYYGNAAATSASDGNATFEFFDDFSSSGNALGYYQLGSAQTVMTQEGWETEAPHTLSVVEVNNGGYQYWGYYGLQGCGGIGIARSNDLLTWIKDPNPLFSGNGERWPSVLLVDGTFYMVHTTNYCGDSYVVLRTSIDGLNFSAPLTLVPASAGHRNQNPSLFLDPNDNKFYLYWYSNNSGQFEVKHQKRRYTRGPRNRLHSGCSELTRCDGSTPDDVL